MSCESLDAMSRFDTGHITESDMEVQVKMQEVFCQATTIVQNKVTVIFVYHKCKL